jgi:hypothetical protein
MSRDDDKSKLGRLWGAGTGREKEAQTDKVIPLERAPAADYVDPRQYKAFRLRDNANRLELRRKKDPSRFPSYQYLLDISYDRFHDSAFSLVFTFMIVYVEGSNLAEVVHAINFGDCGSLVEFDPKHHDKPAKGEAFIESIEIVTVDEKVNEG